jgi:hypothetical protein
MDWACVGLSGAGRTAKLEGIGARSCRLWERLFGVRRAGNRAGRLPVRLDQINWRLWRSFRPGSRLSYTLLSLRHRWTAHRLEPGTEVGPISPSARYAARRLASSIASSLLIRWAKLRGPQRFPSGSTELRSFDAPGPVSALSCSRRTVALWFVQLAGF